MKDVNKRSERIGLERLNKQKDLMRIIEYYDTDNIIVEFQDKYRAKVHTSYRHFKNGNVKNPYCPSVLGVGIIGNKYPCSVNRKVTKEYALWQNVLCRSYSEEYKSQQPTYKDVICCDEWLVYDNFYEWIHNQENFDKWLSGERWAIDKDILIKGNKVYSPKTCCLVPQHINSLFTKQDVRRGDLPIGVSRHKNIFRARIHNIFTNKIEVIDSCDTPVKAFQAYKVYKEQLIKQVARLEYSKGNITKQCYDAMMRYEVEITNKKLKIFLKYFIKIY